jgi:hypothetical protein
MPHRASPLRVSASTQGAAVQLTISLDLNRIGRCQGVVWLRHPVLLNQQATAVTAMRSRVPGGQ